MASPAKKPTWPATSISSARPFEHEEALLCAQRDLARIDRKLAGHTRASSPPGPARIINTDLDDEAAA